jgi:lysyl-tRNA synthetase class 2
VPRGVPGGHVAGALAGLDPGGTCGYGAETMLPFPDRWHGVTDVEQRSRQRYVDLFVNEDTRATFLLRSAVVRWIRDFFHGRDYVEVETPMMQLIPGGAAARPFVTHHNALDLELYLRIAPELYLKRLVVGGMERVFEINRNFRNEGVSVKHNPEFTMLEFYEAWATHEDLIELTEDLLGGLVPAVCGGATSVPYGEHVLDFAPPYRRADMDLLISEQTGLTRAQLRDVGAMADWWCAHKPSADRDALPKTMGRFWELLFDALVEHTLIQPTFVTGFPTEISPLSRKNDADPAIVDRFELYVAGREIGNAFSELNDPVDQAARFAEQAAARDAGDEEGMYFDHDYVRALVVRHAVRPRERASASTAWSCCWPTRPRFGTCSSSR